MLMFSSGYYMGESGAMEKLLLPLATIAFMFLVLAVNGTSEAFLHAVGSKRQLVWSNMSLLLFSTIYITLNVLLVQYAGAVGLIAADSCNMMLRITYSAVFMKQFFKHSASFSLHRCFPSAGVCLVLLMSGIITRMSEKLLLDADHFVPTMLAHLLVGLACFCMSAFTIYRRERAFIQKLLELHQMKLDIPTKAKRVQTINTATSLPPFIGKLKCRLTI